MTDELEPFASKMREIRHQLECNVEIIKRDKPDPEPRILPHVIEILTGHVEDRLKELETIVAELLSRRAEAAGGVRVKALEWMKHPDDEEYYSDDDPSGDNLGLYWIKPDETNPGNWILLATRHIISEHASLEAAKAEPSLSVLHRSIDVTARAALNPEGVDRG